MDGNVRVIEATLQEDAKSGDVGKFLRGLGWAPCGISAQGITRSESHHLYQMPLSSTVLFRFVRNIPLLPIFDPQTGGATVLSDLEDVIRVGKTREIDDIRCTACLVFILFGNSIDMGRLDNVTTIAGKSPTIELS